MLYEKSVLYRMTARFSAFQRHIQSSSDIDIKWNRAVTKKSNPFSSLSNESRPESNQTRTDKPNTVKISLGFLFSPSRLLGLLIHTLLLLLSTHDGKPLHAREVRFDDSLLFEGSASVRLKEAQAFKGQQGNSKCCCSHHLLSQEHQQHSWYG